MQTANVTVVVGGATYTGFKDVEIEAGVKDAARSFSLTIADSSGGQSIAAKFAGFTPIQIYESGELIISGYVDRRKPALRKDSAETVICGRSKGQDAIDCSPKHKTGNFKQQTPLQIMQQLDQFGIGFSSDMDLTPIDYQLQPGAPLFSEGEKMARDQGGTLFGLADGSIRVTKAGATAKRQGGQLVEGVNILEISGDFNDANRHSEIRVRGQSATGHGADAMQIEGVAMDSTVPRNRPLIFALDANTDKTRAKGRAVNRRDKAAGAGIKASATTPGWRDESGQLWEPGNLVWTSSPYLALEQDMLIEHIVYKETEADSYVLLQLVDPRAHGGKASKAGQSASTWNMDTSAGTEDD